MMHWCVKCDVQLLPKGHICMGCGHKSDRHDGKTDKRAPEIVTGTDGNRNRHRSSTNSKAK